MILGIDIPEGARVEVSDNKIFIIFDENKTKRDLWKASFWMWLTKGITLKDFYANEAISSKRIEISNKNALKMFAGK